MFHRIKEIFHHEPHHHVHHHSEEVKARRHERHQHHRSKHSEGVTDVDERKSHEYQLLNIVGEGTFAKVYEAIHIEDGRCYAVKVMHRKSPKGGLDALINNEIQILSKISVDKHPNVISLVDHYQLRDETCLVMELLHGPELFDSIVQRGEYTEKMAVKFIKQIVDAVKFVHKHNIVHRDVKPENLIFREKSEESALVLVDFGTARMLEKGMFLRAACGTVGYNAPEVLLETGHDHGCDVWGVGIVTYVLLTGHLPFSNETKDVYLKQTKKGDLTFDVEHWSKISKEAQDFIKALLVFDPKHRITIDEASEMKWLHEEHDHLEHDLLGNIRHSLDSLRGSGSYLLRDLQSEEELTRRLADLEMSTPPPQVLPIISDASANGATTTTAAQ